MKDSTPSEIDETLQKAQVAFQIYKNVSGKDKATLLRTIATEIENLGSELITTAMEESNLPEGRLIGERGRTVGQLRLFADLLSEGSWVEASIDTALPDRIPIPKPDIRKMLIPLGNIVVFGASNFPLAFSTAGGDTASALASGCTVIVKAHPAHPATSTLVASAIWTALEKCNLPKEIFSHLYGRSADVGKNLVLHPLTNAVAFTGSFLGGKALFDLANQRKKPIPVFAEMGSINPVLLMPQALKNRAESIAVQFAGSITLGAGQFCTKSGVLIGIESPELESFTTYLAQQITQIKPATMLYDGIAHNYDYQRLIMLAQTGVKLEAESATSADKDQAMPTIASVSAQEFLKNPTLHEEVFGAFALIIRCKNKEEMQEIVQSLEGQLTATVIAEPEELLANRALVDELKTIVGRIVFNSVPTGVEVCYSMHHGGVFPATTDSRFTSVGASAIKRFARPICLQGFPEEMLPPELQSANPLIIWRLVNGKWHNAKL
jgi:NADP-dependent aldehyde dehydrogenase